ncbi:hypothetical protein SEPCBS119000_005296 [Sporothrix epigloea]|uniref:WW domain-containing protein n=1 Tax=Sporothrix epigloea TaxID=1892477 RepID=A0ABP0DWT6_9PEZI
MAAEESSDVFNDATATEYNSKASGTILDGKLGANPESRTTSEVDELEPRKDEQQQSGTESSVSRDGAIADTLAQPTQEPRPVGSDDADTAAAPASSPPPLPDEPLPDEADLNDDGWDPVWSEEYQAWYFVNRFTQQTQWENPRVPAAETNTSSGATLGGYNPAIHGDYDPDAWYAKGGSADDGVSKTFPDYDTEADPIAAAAAAAAALIQEDARRGNGADYNARAGRQLDAYFDVAATSNAHDGRSLKAERSGIKPSKSELKAFKEKRRARKEEKRRAWLRD